MSNELLFKVPGTFEQFNLNGYRAAGEGKFTASAGNYRVGSTHYTTLGKLNQISSGKSIAVVVSEPSWCGLCRNFHKGNPNANYLTIQQAKAIGWKSSGIPSRIMVKDGKVQ